MKIELTVNGFTDTYCFPEAEIAAVHLPILTRISSLASSATNRIIVLFGAPPGAGKSTIAAFWSWLSYREPGLIPVQALSIDGFHYPNSYLSQHCISRHGRNLLLLSVKGAPETYDVHALRAALSQLKDSTATAWPIYDRNIHDPVPDAITIRASIAIVEGNWVLLNEPDWRCLRGLADLTIFLEADEGLVRDRLIRRKIRGGFTLTEAEAHYELSDKPNLEKALRHHLPADVTLQWEKNVRHERVIMSDVTMQRDEKWMENE